MTDGSSNRPVKSAAYQAAAREAALAAGKSEAAAEALVTLDSEFFQSYRMAVKGEVPGRIIAELGGPLELSQFSALTAITRIQCGIGRAEPQPATIGLLAEEMAIDPSRASRVASDLIAKGLVRREALQEDGRVSVLAPTETAMALLDEFRALKWQKYMQVFAEWSDDDLVTFARLFQRYRSRLSAVYHAEE